jgi:hypothetical protein
VDLLAPEEEREELRRRAGQLPALQLTERSVCDLELLASGGFSPLDRFMGRADHDRVIGEMRLDGTSAAAKFSTPFFSKGTQDEYSIAVYDVQGNQRSASVSITPVSGLNQSPQPSIRLSGSLIEPGEAVTLDASLSIDPDGSSSLLQVEWDLNGDGLFDTLPSFDKTFSISYEQPGARLLYARLTDTLGDWSVSSPLALRVVPEPTLLLWAAGVIALLRRRRRVA